MTFDEAVTLTDQYGATASPILPRANWIELHGVFTPEQLRAFAVEVERRYDSQRPKR